MREIDIVAKNTSKHFEDTHCRHFDDPLLCHFDDTNHRHFELGEAMREIHKITFQIMDPYARNRAQGLHGLAELLGCYVDFNPCARLLRPEGEEVAHKGF